MFLELMTVWKTKETSALMAAVSTIAGNGGLPWLRSNTSSQHPTALQTDDDVIGTWKLRRTGILFSKQKDSKGDEKWIFLIFIEPEEGEKHLVFTHREINDGGSEPPNTYHETGKLVYCFEREDDIKNLLNYIALNLERGPNYLTDLAEDVLWGWGEFLKQMRGEILSVVDLPEIKLTNLQIREKTERLAELSTSRHCWRLFRYRLILAKANVLPRAMKLLDKLTDQDPQTGRQITTIPFGNSKKSLERIEMAVENDLKLIQGTIEMVHIFVFSSDDPVTK
jgi:hypothetical protein